MALTPVGSCVPASPIPIHDEDDDHVAHSSSTFGLRDDVEDTWSPAVELSKYGLTWVRRDNGTRGVIRTTAVDIDAPIDHVWGFINDPARYSNLTTTTLMASPKKEKRLKIFKGVAPRVVCNARKVKSMYWSAKLPLSRKRAERFHILVPLGPGKTRSYLAEKVPGLLSVTLFGARREGEANVLQAVNNQLKKESEKSTLTLVRSFLSDLAFFITHAKALLWKLTSLLDLR